MKAQSVFFDDSIKKRLRRSVKKGGYPADLATDTVEQSKWWMERSYEELHRLMFGSTLKRSWFVLSYGVCPACDGSVPLYKWIIDAKNKPWKVECPHCAELFPKNDFAAYYRSGLDKDGAFDRSVADPSLLRNEAGTDFGVDDGNGYVDAVGERWLFVAAYLVHGHWLQLITKGIETLAFAHLLTGDREYARRAVIMLHGVSRFFPDHDFEAQGVMYEEEHTSSGYVTYWVNTCHDLKLLALAYDMVFEDVVQDEGLGELLGLKTARICADIEERIFEEALAHPERYDSNPPDPDFVRIILNAVLRWPENRDEVESAFCRMVEDATRVDGLVGEKGLATYAALAPVKLADAMLLFSNTDGDFLEKTIRRHPALRKTYRFHIDTWYAERHYPGCGDGGYFGATYPSYLGTLPVTNPRKLFQRSREWFTWKLNEFFEDPAFAQAMYLSNGRTCKRLFDDDLYLEHPGKLREELQNLIDTRGEHIEQRSINYQQWRIALLHSGTGANRRMLSMGYDSGANHSHQDALNINLYYKGINLSPDFGYPPVNYGGWSTREVEWYRHPASHNLVVIDGNGHENLPDGKFLRFPAYGRTVLWHTGGFAQAVYADAKEYAGVDRYERLAAMVDVTEEEAYFVDIFRVSGGGERTKFFRSLPGPISARGIKLEKGEDYGHGSIMRDFRTDEGPPAGWSVDFFVDQDRGIHLTYFDPTGGVSATLCESWADITRMPENPESTGNRVIWVPTVAVRKKDQEPTFIGVLAPWEKKRCVTSVRRLVVPEADGVAVEVVMADGRADLILAGNPEGDGILRLPGYEVESDALFCAVRMKNGEVEDTSVPDGSMLRIAGKDYSIL